MNKQKETIQEMIAVLKYRDVTLSQIEDELLYRCQSDLDTRLDNELYEYKTEELLSAKTEWND